MGINIKNDEQHYRTTNVQFFNIKGEMTDQFINDRNIKPFLFKNNYYINKGDKLAQLVIVPIWTPELEEVTEFDTQSTRGTNGFGSTGY